MWKDITGETLPALVALETTHPHLVYGMLGEPYMGTPPFDECTRVLEALKKVVSGDSIKTSMP